MAEVSSRHPGLRCGGLALLVIFGLKLVLWLVATQPIPANDAFFYDGGVVNWLLHGRYVNPSIALALPVSGTQLFSPYPPLYQCVLLPWMGLFGTSVQSATALHLVLFGGYLLALWATLQRLRTPAWCANFGALFAAGITFHDRPDTLAHLVGAWAIYAWVRSRPFFDPQAGRGVVERWTWIAFGLGLLSLATSFQIGGIYLALVSFGFLATTLFHKDSFPMMAWRTAVMMGIALVVLVIAGMPGFLEHAALTPSFTGLRFPAVADVLKVIKAVPALVVILLLFPATWFKQKTRYMGERGPRHEIVAIVLTLPAAAIVVACLFVLTPNTVAIAGYLQSLVVACYLVVLRELFAHGRWLRWQVVILAGALVVNSTRLIGMSTWGLVCAADVSCAEANERVRNELAAMDGGGIAVVSSAYLYEAAAQTNAAVIHSDWPGAPVNGNLPADRDALLRLKPSKLILTQFDYWRRYQSAVESLVGSRAVEELWVEDMAGVPVPDATTWAQRLAQHISWAPIIVTIEWKGGARTSIGYGP